MILANLIIVFRVVVLINPLLAPCHVRNVHNIRISDHPKISSIARNFLAIVKSISLSFNSQLYFYPHFI